MLVIPLPAPVLDAMLALSLALSVTTHISELVRKTAHELIGRQEIQELLGLVSKEAPKLVQKQATSRPSGSSSPSSTTHTPWTRQSDSTR